MSRGRNERGAADRPRAIPAISPPLAPKCEPCTRAFSSPDLDHDSITRTERDENLPLATTAVDHSRTRWRADVSTREKSNVTSGAEGATTALGRTAEEWPAIRKRPSFPPSPPLDPRTSFRLFPFRLPPPSPSFCPLPTSSLPKGCEGGREGRARMPTAEAGRAASRPNNK